MNVENRFFMIDTNKSISLLLFSPTDLSLESYFFKDNVIYPKFFFFILWFVEKIFLYVIHLCLA